MESLRYLFASEAEVEEASALDPLQWFQALFKYREIPTVMTAWKQELSEGTEQKVFQVLYPTITVGTLCHLCIMTWVLVILAPVPHFVVFLP